MPRNTNTTGRGRGRVLAAPRHWVFNTRAEAERVRDGFDVAAGMPIKATEFSPGIHGPIPDTWSEGAPGWVGHLVNIDEEPGGTRYALQRTAEAIEHEGKMVRVRGGDVQLPDNTGAEDRGAEWDPTGT